MEHYQPLAELIGFKGINTDFIEELLPNADNPLYLTDAENILIKGGKIHKLPGVGYLNDISSVRGTGSAVKVLGLRLYEKFDLTKRLLVFTPEQAEYLASNTGFSLVGSLSGSDNSILSFANIDDKAVFVYDDEGVVRYWDGSTFAQLLDPATLGARMVLPYKTWLFLLRPLTDALATEEPQTVWPSYPGDIDNFDVEDKLMITATGAINGGRQLEDALIIYFPKSIHRVFLISDTDGFGSLPIAESNGLMAPRTLTGSHAVHYFLGQEGMMELRLGASPAPLSWMKFNKLIIDGIDPLHYHKAVARYYADTGLLYVVFPPAGSAENSTLLIYSAIEKELVGKKTLIGANYSALGVFEKDLVGLTPDERRAYGVGGVPIIGTTGGRVLEQKYTSFQEIDAPYESSITLPPMFFGDRHHNKRLMQADLLVEKRTGNDIEFELDISNEANVKSVTPYTISGVGGAGIRRYVVYIDVSGKEFRVSLRDKANPYDFKLHGIVFRGYFTTLK